MQTYYKVVRLPFGFGERPLMSALGNIDFDLKYIPKQWILPQISNSKLFVFDNFENAKTCNFGTQIWECEVRNPTKIKTILNSNKYFSLKHAEEFWKSKKNKKKSSLAPEFFTSAPKGTVVCDAIKLTKLILDKES